MLSSWFQREYLYNICGWQPSKFVTPAAFHSGRQWVSVETPPEEAAATLDCAHRHLFIVICVFSLEVNPLGGELVKWFSRRFHVVLFLRAGHVQKKIWSVGCGAAHCWISSELLKSSLKSWKGWKRANQSFLPQGVFHQSVPWFFSPSLSSDTLL